MTSLTIVGAFLTGPYVEPTARAILRTMDALPPHFALRPMLISDVCPGWWQKEDWRPLPPEYLNHAHGLVYSPYMVHVLPEYIDTDFAITVQWDGFGFNAGKWTDDFLDYDYIGGPWDELYDTAKDGRVGNGGLSLRSRKWLELGKTSPPLGAYGIPEDWHMCVHAVDHWKNAGCEIAPVKLAQQFSFSRNVHALPGWRLSDSWGFHGFNSPERLALVQPTHQHGLSIARY